jgi:hypothetical protein
MRLSLFILGVFIAIFCIEKPAKAAQNHPWCAYYNGTGAGGDPRCWYATLEQCVADVRFVGGNCGPSPFPPSPRMQTGRPSRRARLTANAPLEFFACVEESCNA